LDQPQTSNRPDPVTDTPDTAAPPLTPLEWLKANAFFLALLIGGTAAVLSLWGPDALFKGFKVVVGIGLVIFIHELGHFLAAKWCDVHVKTFSLGFGPAFPGCSLQRGETTYKIAMIPLGGYVSMVGEGTEEGEDEDYPRSFKNKTVGQRMLIISAGVIMNVIMAFVFFIGVYRFAGVESVTGEVGAVEPGSPAWTKGVRSDMTILQVGSIKNPSFDNLRMRVSVSRQGSAIPFVFVPRHGVGERLEVSLEPRKEENDAIPVIGVAPPYQTKLWPEKLRDYHELPVGYSSPAADARILPLNAGDVVLKATDPDHGGERTTLQHDRSARTFDVLELCRRLRKLGNGPLVLEVHRAGSPAGAAPETVTVPSGGFEFDDTIVGTTDPEHPQDPWRIAPLPLDRPQENQQHHDYSVFRARMRQLAGKPLVVQVVRAHSAGQGPLNILVPPAYHVTFGLRMNMGPVAGVREKSPAASAAVQKGDRLSKVVMRFEDQTSVEFAVLDPVRLPFALAQAAARKPGRKSVQLTVLRPNPDSHDALHSTPLEEVVWDESWDTNVEEPIGVAAPLSIPQLGIAYRVESTVVEVTKGSPAERAGLEANDQVEEIRFRDWAKKRDGPVKWGPWFKLEAKRDNDHKWAHVFSTLQKDADFPEVQVKVRRKGNLLEEPIQITAEVDETWPLEYRGIRLISDTRLHKADTMWQALTLGMDKTYEMVIHIYAFLHRILEGRVSAKHVGGPILIFQQAYEIAGRTFAEFLLFLGIISINLAVVNFLPIPILDGGHMVFLIYEKLRGRPPSEAVRTGATYVGLALLLSLMLFVFYNDIERNWRSWFGG
jgi:regulator of sigma E protease